jgi:hypothetical protein
MLSLQSVAAEKEPFVTFDQYVPISVEVSVAPPQATTVYWRFKASPGTLIEVGLHWPSGMLQSIVVPSVDAAVISIQPGREGDTECRLESGTPCFDTTEWHVSDDFASRFRDDLTCTPRMRVGSDSCVISLDETASPDRIVAFGRVRCSFANGRLVRIGIVEVRAVEHDVLCRFAEIS